MFTQQQQIDRLATTSRLLYDVRIISQRQEIERQRKEIKRQDGEILYLNIDFDMRVIDMRKEIERQRQQIEGQRQQIEVQQQQIEDQEQKIEGQQQQIEQLNLDIFWRDYSLNRFNEAMKLANYTHVQCACDVCKTKKKHHVNFDYYHHEEDETACTFLPWLYNKMDEHGFVVKKGFGIMHYPYEPFEGALSPDHCEDKPCHFFNTTLPDTRGRLPEMSRVIHELSPEEAAECAACPQRDFGLFRFGLFLTDAKTVDDPNLKKYKDFLRMLSETDEVY
jgi:hypothetical protein